MAMRLDKDGLVQYIRQWIKDTAKINLDEPLATRFLNMAYIESADRGMWKIERATVALTVSKGDYTMTELGLEDMIRPSLVLFNGKKMLDTDHESMAYAGAFNEDATDGEPTMISFQTGDMTIRPKPDADSAAKPLTILYAATPAELTDAAPNLDGKFRTAWQEILCWLVLKRVIMMPKEEEPRTLFMSPDQIDRECSIRLDKLRKDVWGTAVTAMKLKDRSCEIDAALLSRNFFTS